MSVKKRKTRFEKLGRRFEVAEAIVEKVYEKHVIECPECNEASVESRVYLLEGPEPSKSYKIFRDEKGDLHYHDPNKYGGLYFCSEKHFWGAVTWINCQCEMKEVERREDDYE